MGDSTTVSTILDPGTLEAINHIMYLIVGGIIGTLTVLIEKKTMWFDIVQPRIFKISLASVAAWLVCHWLAPTMPLNEIFELALAAVGTSYMIVDRKNREMSKTINGNR
jgi:uncharacterized membrane protein YeaQ/YmgE (transglycosylase-associated protein family)